ncbi:MAG TPA: Zn-dependent alcohol dehydrogenase [bacterium]|nr:Zn-dependent alcohol dehydrogenase [bacterium]
MRAAVFYEVGKPLVVEEVELAPPRVGEVLVRIAATGVCHSDLNYIKGDLTIPLPVVLGHEAAGIVESVGSGVTSVRPGDHVVLLFAPACGHCRYCDAGRPHLCEMRYRVRGKMPDGTTRLRRGDQELHHFTCVSSWAEQAVVPESGVLPITKDLPLTIAALLGCAVTTGVGAVTNTARVRPGSSVAVFGLGGVGLNVVQGARIAGAVTIIGVDLLNHRLEAARRFGATHTVNARASDPVQTVLELTRGGADYAFEVIGRAASVRQAIDSVARGGVAVVVGLPPAREELVLPGPAFVLDEKTLRGCFYGSARLRSEIPRLVSLYAAGRLMLDELVTASFPLDRVNDAVAALDRGDGLRSILQMSAA